MSTRTTPAAINPAHALAVYEYTDKVADPYYRGKRFISANTLLDAKSTSERTVIVATADTVEECQRHIPSGPMEILGWLLHQNAQSGGALGRLLAGEDAEAAVSQREAVGSAIPA